MNVIQNERVIMVDIDDTLVMHNWDNSKYTSYANELKEIICPNTGDKIKVFRNESNICMVREEAARGSHIVAWSSGGYAWAEAVIKALNLTSCIASIMTKPTAYFDDRPAKEWMGRRVYLQYDKPYKQKTEE